MSGGPHGLSRAEIIADIETERIENAQEAMRQKSFLERGTASLQARINTTKEEAARANRARLKENSHLIFECNELRKEGKTLHRRLESVSNELLDAKKLVRSLVRPSVLLLLSVRLFTVPVCAGGEGERVGWLGASTDLRAQYERQHEHHAPPCHPQPPQQLQPPPQSQ